MSKNILLVVLSVSIVLFFAEFSARLLVDESQLSKIYQCPETGHPAYTSGDQCPTSQDRISKMEFSRDLLYRPVPNAIGEGWSHDKHGFRSSGNGKGIHGSNLLKIAITGGSTAWGVGVRDDQTIASVLRNILSEKCTQSDIEVINAAVSAQTSGQERRRFETDVLPLEIDIYIAVTGFNDIYNAYTGLLPHQNRDYFDILRYFNSAAVDDAVPQPPKVNNYFFRLYYLFDKAIYKSKVTEKDMKVILRKRALPHSITVDAIQRNALLLNNWGNRYNYEYLFALQPSIYNTNKKLTSGELYILKQDPHFGEYNSNGYEELRKNMVEMNLVHYIDLDDAIKSSSDELFIDSVHFGDRGYYIIASYLAETIMKKSDVFRTKCSTEGTNF